MKKEDLRQTGYNIPVKVSHVLRAQHSKIKETCGLLDTGASITVVSFTIIEYLNLQSNINKKTDFHTPFLSNRKGAQCPLKFTFIDHNNKLIDINTNALCVFGEDLDIGKSEALIGRDVLKYFDFNWNGPGGLVTINFIQNPIGRLDI